MNNIRVKTNTSMNTYRAGRAAVRALEEAEAAFSDQQIQRTGFQRAVSFMCSKHGLTLLLLLGVSTHMKQLRTFFTDHVLHQNRVAVVSAEDESAGEQEGKPRTALGRSVARATQSKEAISDHNSETIEAADAILDGAD